MRPIKLMLLFIVCFMPFSAFAQESQIHLPKGTNYNKSGVARAGGVESHIHIPKGTNWSNNAAAITQILKQQSKTQGSNKQPVKKVYMSIVHPDYLEPQQFGLLMKVANSQSGCFEFSPIEYETKYIENHYMDITLKDYRRTQIETRHPHFDCNQGEKVISTMVVLNANDLRDKKIREIRFSNGQARDAYKVQLTENSVRLVPKSMIAFKAEGLVGPDFDYIEHQFTDNSLITLQVPMALPSDDIAQAVRNLGYEYSLTPLFGEKQAGHNKFYFRDDNGALLDRLAEQGYTELGTVQILRPYVAREGRQGTPINLKVFLTKPNVSL